MKRKAFSLAASLLVCAVSGGLAAQDLTPAYQRASGFLPWRINSWLTQHELHSAQWSADGREFRYTVRGPAGVREMVGDARTGKVARAGNETSSRPPYRIGLEGFNLHLIEPGTDKRIALTADGTEDNAYSPVYEFGVILESERQSLRGPMREASGVWSPDGRWFATYQYDQRGVGKQVYWYAVTEKGYGSRPRFTDQVAPYPGEKNAVAHLVLIDTQTRTVRHVAEAKFETFLDPIESGIVQWSADSASVFYLNEGRGLRSVSVNRINVADGTIAELFRETSETYLMLSGSRDPAIWRVLGDGRRMLWFSERDGWGNLYLVDLTTGKVLHPITTGQGVATKLLRVDEASGWVYFVACGRDPKVDPYFRYAYRARLDGRGVQVLTPEAGDHVVSMPAAGDAFIDVQSAGVAAPPRSVLRALDGKVRATLASTDAAELQKRGWRAPERVKVRSADGRYDLYATVFKPTNYDPARRYPVLDYIYGLSSLARTPWSFPLGPTFEMAESYWHSHALAELGFIVVKLDSPGTPLRGHQFARESYGAGHIGAMLDHHVAGIRQLAARDPAMDLDRVGIFGSSGGGFTSTRAMLLHPDFFKAAVSFAGSHDLLRLYGPEWADRYIGPIETNRDTYEKMSNTTFADRLAGKLLLVHGEADTEVTVSMTQQLVHALITANKDFDLLYVPNAEHELDRHPYAVRRRWDYFVRELRQEEPPASFSLPARD